MERSLSRRFLIIFSILTCSIVAIAGVYTYYSARSIIYKDYDAQLISEAHILWMMASEEINEARGLQQIDLDFAAPSMDEHQRMVLSQYTQDRAFRIWHNNELIVQSDTAKSLNAPITKAGFHAYNDGALEWRGYTMTAPGDGVTIETWEKMDNRNRVLLSILDELAEMLVVLIPAAAFLLYFSIRFGLHDVFRMAHEIERRDIDDLTQLELGKIPRELSPLRNAINSLLSKIAKMLEREHQFIDDAAHELKTPLAVLKLQSQLIEQAPTEKDRQDCIAVLQEGVDRTRKVFDQILMLSRISGENVDLKEIAIIPFLRVLITDRAVIAAQKDLDISLDGNDGIILSNSDLLSILLGIILDNAIKYTPSGGSISVVVSEKRIEIIDSGSGIPDSEKERVFDRFYRVKGDETQGSGLGLSIARKVSEILNLKIELENIPPSKGLKAKVIFR